MLGDPREEAGVGVGVLYISKTRREGSRGQGSVTPGNSPNLGWSHWVRDSRLPPMVSVGGRE